MAVRASDYVKRPNSPTAASKRPSRSPMSMASKKEGGASWSFVRWFFVLVILGALGVLVWLNLHVKSTTIAEHHGGGEDSSGSHKNTHILHNIFGADLGKTHTEGFSRDTWSREWNSMKDAVKSSAASMTEGAGDFSANKIIEQIREGAAQLRGSVGTDGEHSHSHSHDGNGTGTQGEQHSHSHPISGHHDSEHDGHGFDSTHGGEAGAGANAAQQGHESDGADAGSLLSKVQWINDLIDATYPGGHAPKAVQQNTRSHPHEDYTHQEHAHEATSADADTGSSLLSEVQWINDLIDATYPDGHALTPKAAHSDSDSHSALHAAAAARDREAEMGGEADPADTDTGSLMDKVRWINNLIDATYPDGHAPDKVHKPLAPHQEHEAAAVEVAAATADPSSLLSKVQWINDLIDATYPGGHAPKAKEMHMHSHPHSHDGGDTAHTHEHVSVGEHHTDGHAATDAATDLEKVKVQQQQQQQQQQQPVSDHDDEVAEDDNVAVSSDAAAQDVIDHGHGLSAGSAAALEHNPLHHDSHDHHESGPKEGEEVVKESAHHEHEHAAAAAAAAEGDTGRFRTRMLKKVRRQLREHPLHSLPFRGQASGGKYEGHKNKNKIENNNEHASGDSSSIGIGMDSSIFDILPWLQRQPQCENKPIFLSMAHVVGEMYWQLIENFVYTLLKFEMSDCSIMVCVDDMKCMQKCRENDFPCYSFEYESQHAHLPEIALLGAQAGYADPALAPSKVRKPPVMELIAYLKLYHIPKAMQSGLGAVAVLDLDVGFLESPQAIVDYMYDLKKPEGQEGQGDKIEDGMSVLKPSRNYKKYNNLEALVQQDVTFIMNRSEAGWKQWWTEPMPNIGVLLLKSTPKVIQMFETAWRSYYQTAKVDIRMNPGKDQNKVVSALQRHGGRSGAGFGSDTSGFDSHKEKPSRLAWRYIPVTEAVLIDKIFKFVDQAVELGGGATADILAPSVFGGVADMEFMHKNSWEGSQGDEFKGPVPKASVVHVTCFEKGTKLMGLKAANAFWNPFYYDPMRPTITKKLLAFNKFKNNNVAGGSTSASGDGRRSSSGYSGKPQKPDVGYLDLDLLEQEVHSLVYLALKLNRTLIIPNVLLEKTEKGTQMHHDLYSVDPQKSNVIQRPEYKGNTIWPGFRVLNLNTHHNDPQADTVLRVKQVEPAYYWRVVRDYNSDSDSSDVNSNGNTDHDHGVVPEPTVVTFTAHKDNDLAKVEETLSAFSHEKAPRMVIHTLPSLEDPKIVAKYGKMFVEPKIFVSHTSEEEESLASIHPFTKGELFVKSEQAKMKKWAQDSVGDFEDWKTESLKYAPVRSLHGIIENERKGLVTSAWGAAVGGRADEDQNDREYISNLRAKHIMDNSRLCANIGERMRGNRSCFGKCG